MNSSKSFKSIEEYMLQFPKEMQSILKKIKQIIKKAAPNAEESISYGMPTFKLNKKPLVYYAGYKNHIGFYALPSGNEYFAKEIKKYKTGKGSIQFPLEKEMPWKLIEDIVKFRVKETQEK